jgi:zinc D-Ala-D-Ala dipeptidase
MTALVSITAGEYDIDISLAYATADNFTGRPIYARAIAYLHPEAAAALKRAVALAAALDLRIRLFDAYRPTEAQWVMWNHTPDPEFLADPNRGSPHSRGAAVDVTLVDKAGNDLDMGTAFDAFTPLSHHGSTVVPARAQQNRFVLLGLMSAAGWDFYRNEWWHYQLFNASRLPLISDTALSPGLL